MDQKRIKETAEQLKLLLLKYGSTDKNVQNLFEIYSSIITEALEEKITAPRKLGGSHGIFESGNYESYPDLKTAWSRFFLALRDIKEPVNRIT